VSAEFSKRFEKSQALYCNWLAARADCADPGPATGWSEEDMAARSRKCDAAELALLVTPALNPECFFQKWEVLEHLVAYEAQERQLTNHRTTLALAAVKADLLRFELKNPE
jgi:hypothetical protein